MDDERYMILKMLEEGKITAEEASALLAALDEPDESGVGDGFDDASGTTGESDWEEEPSRGHRGRHGHRSHRQGSSKRRSSWFVFDTESFNRDMEELRRDMEKVRINAAQIGDEVSRRVREATERSEWRRGGPRGMRHFVRNIGDIFSVPFGGEMHEETIEKEAAIPEGDPSEVTVFVKNLSGDVDVTTWDRAAVGVKAIKRVWADTTEHARERAGDYVIDVTLEGKEVRVGAQLTDEAPGWLPARCTIDYKVQVPAGVRVKTTLTNGDVNVTGVNGGVELKSTNGNVRALDVTGGIIASSTNGDVSVKDAAASELSLKTINGDIQADLASLAPGSHVITTARGDVEVGLPADARLDFRASTMHGEIRFDLPGKIVSRTSTRLQAQLGPQAGQDQATADQSGGPEAGAPTSGVPSLDIRALFGDVSVRARQEGQAK